MEILENEGTRTMKLSDNSRHVLQPINFESTASTDFGLEAT